MTGGADGFSDLTQVEDDPERLFQDEIFADRRIAFENDGHDPVVVVQCEAHPFEQAGIGDGNGAGIESGVSRQKDLELAGAVAHRIREVLVGFQDDAREAVVVGSPEIDGQGHENLK